MTPLRHRFRNALLPVAARVIGRRRADAELGDTILILQPDHLGDILLSQPAVRHLRRSFPASRLIAVVGPWSRRIAELAWPVDEVVTVRFPGFARDGAAHLVDPYRQLPAEARKLGALKASTAVVLRPDAWWAAWLAAAAGTPNVVTGDNPRCTPFASRTVAVPGDAHAVARALAIARAVTGDGETATTPQSAPLALPLLEAASASISARLDELGIERRAGYVVIHPGAGAPVKQWPVHHWSAVARALAASGLGVVITGSTTEHDTAAKIAREVPGAVEVAGQTSLDELVELMRGAALAIGPDCGPLHLAVAVMTSTIHLFGPSDPLRYGPWGPAYQHRVIRAGWSCPRCGDLSVDRDSLCGCMMAIEPSSVVATAYELLGAHAVA